MPFRAEPCPTTPASVSIVVVAWHSGDDLVRCIGSLAQARARVPESTAHLDLVVVDNGGDALSEALAPWPDARLIRNEENRGFAAAANQGVAAGRGEIVLFLNPDVRAAGEPFSPLLAGFASHPGAVALAPLLLDTGDDGHATQRGFQLRHLPTWPGLLRDALLIDELIPGGRWRLRERYLDLDRSRPFPVEQAAAAALAVRRTALEALGGFDESFFPAWFEDVDLCRRLRACGEILYWPASTFAHRGGASARELGFEVFLPLLYANAHRYWRKHRGPASAVALRGVVASGMALRLLAVAFASGGRPRSTAARAYARVLRGAIGLDRSFRITAEDTDRWARAPACRP